MLFFFLGIVVTIIAFFSTYKRKLFLFSFLIIALIMSLQDGAGTDYESYISRFGKINRNQLIISNAIFAPSHGSVEVGWGWINRKFSSVGFVPMLIVLCLFESLALYILIKKFVLPKWYWFSVFYFFFVPNLLAMQMSALRQALAIAFFTLGFICVFNKKFILSMLLTFIGALFHQSAIIMLFFQFFFYLIINFKKEDVKIQQKIPYKLVITTGLIYILIVLFQSKIVNIITQQSLLLGKDIGRYEEYLMELDNEGITIAMHIYFFSSTICTSLAFKGANREERIVLSILLFIFITQTVFFGADTFSRITLYLQICTIPGISIVANRLRHSYSKEVSYIFVTATIYYAVHYMINFMSNPYGIDFAKFKFIFY